MNVQTRADSRLRELKSQLASSIRRMRNLKYLIEKEEFTVAFRDATTEDRDAVARLIQAGDKSAVENWLNRKRTKPIEEMSVRDLYTKAQQEWIPNYKRIPTEQLRAELIRLRDS